MANVPDAAITPEQILKQMGEVVRSTSSDSFRVRVARKANAAQVIPNVIGTLDGATSEHLQSPEVWLSQFSGGGHYFLQAMHKSNPTAPFPPLQVVISGDPQQPDPYADASPTWRGPSEIVMPEKKKRTEDGSVLHVDPAGAMGTPPRNGVHQGSVPAGSAPPAPGDPLAAERWRLEMQREESTRRERASAEERHKQELDLVRRAQELEVAKLRAEMIGARKPEGESEMSKFLMVMREEAKQREEREERRRQEERDREEKRLEREREREEKRLADERVREDRRLEREREDRKEREAERARLEERVEHERKEANERFMQMMTERQGAQEQMMKMMQPVAEMMGTSMNVVVQALHSISELAPQGESDPPYLKLVGKIVDGIQAAAAAARHDRVVRPPAMSGAAARAPQRPAPRVVSPPPPPPPAPVEQSAQGFAGYEPPPPAPRPPNVVRITAMQQLIRMVKSKKSPDDVARFFYSHLNDPSIASELAANDMRLVPTFVPHFAEWLKDNEENQQYMSKVFERVSSFGEEMGVVAPVEVAEEEVDGGEGEEGEEGEEEVEEGEDGVDGEDEQEKEVES